MYGVLNVLKPPGMTSHDVVSQMRRIFRIKKVGHAGTLDPQAAGVLPICIGQATRLVEYLSGDDKEYFCRLTLGIKTTTQDAWGDILEKKSCEHVSLEDIEVVLKRFRGKITQKTPMFSAVKINGVPLYKMARAGKTVETRSREVMIKYIRFVEFNSPEIALVVGCSKGTYIRTLCNDIGEALQVGAHMSFLIRTSVGDFSIEDSLTMEQIEELREKAVMPIHTCISGLKRIVLNDDEILRIKQGQLLGYENLSQDDNMTCSVFDGTGELHAIVMIIRKDDNKYYLKPQKVFNVESK